jgi:hypothetical protein
MARMFGDAATKRAVGALRAAANGDAPYITGRAHNGVRE